MTHLIELGREKEIAKAELRAVLGAGIRIHDVSETTVSINAEIDPEELMQRLGGTIKISSLEGSRDDVYEYLFKKEGKIHFSLHNGRKGEALQLKKKLKKAGRSVRYVPPKNTATIIFNKLVKKEGDITIMKDSFYVTRAIQDIQGFARRDYDRPAHDDKSGMLPPKLARILINLSGAQKDARLLDPFCGSGTVLMEAHDLGFTHIFGSDISEKAVNDTKKNLSWLGNETAQVMEADAQNLNHKNIDVIVTEPYLGKPLRKGESEQMLQKQSVELKQLYVDAFKSFANVLSNEGVVIFIIPQFKTKTGWIFVDCINEIKKLGFVTEPFFKQEHLLYRRENQHLGRQIWKFTAT